MIYQYSASIPGLSPVIDFLTFISPFSQPLLLLKYQPLDLILLCMKLRSLLIHQFYLYSIMKSACPIFNLFFFFFLLSRASSINLACLSFQFKHSPFLDSTCYSSCSGTPDKYWHLLFQIFFFSSYYYFAFDYYLYFSFIFIINLSLFG
jgi:hypothetical protein